MTTAAASLLDEVSHFLRRYVVLTPDQCVMESLFIAHCHAISAFDTTGYLAITSSEKRSGKTRNAEIIELLVPNPLRTESISAAALVRLIDDGAPTLVMDEADATFGGPTEFFQLLRGILNSGYRRGGSYCRCEGEGKKTVTRFSTYCPKVICGIGRLPDTVADRCIPIRLRRRARTEVVSRFRLREAAPLALDLKSRLAAYVESILPVLSEARPDLPDDLNDRAQECVEPLLAVADAVGGEWPRLARAAAVAIFTSKEGRDESLGVRLLGDIRCCFDQRGEDRLPSAALVEALLAIEGAPWTDYAAGRPISSSRLARALEAYDISPRSIRIGQRVLRGYLLDDFSDAFSRYLPDKVLPPLQAAAGALLADAGDVLLRADVAARELKVHAGKQGRVADVAMSEFPQGGARAISRIRPVPAAIPTRMSLSFVQRMEEILA